MRVEVVFVLFVLVVPSDEIISLAPYDTSESGFRLPNNTIPIRYQLSLTTDVHRGETAFSGTAKIRIQAVETTSEITLHHRQMTIDIINLYTNPAAPQLLENNVKFLVREEFDFMIIQPNNQLTVNQIYLVEIKYHGLLRDDNRGFYRSSYQSAQGQTVWLATTQFESTDARHAFPCYDEPQIRMPFEIEIKHDASYEAISNMPVASRTVENGTNYVVTKFQDTLPMQTYLIAFVISNFKYIANDDQKQQRVYAKPQSIENNEASFGLEVGKKLMDEFVKHLDVNYNLPKIDQVSIPDFVGGMEHWGLVTYGEEFLLLNQELATTQQRQTVTAVIAHEYAHQWFGNHVAPNWWSYLWLNEGFATLYEYYLASLVYPDDRLIDLFVVNAMQTVLDVDASESIRPMTHYVESPEKVSGLFDRIAYDKAGSVLRMMQVALGVTTWTKGLKNYLLQRQYKSATPDDLYNGLQQAVNEDYTMNAPDVATIFRSWETQSGYPMVTVARDGDRITFTQDRFYYTSQTSSSVWWVPINYVVASNPNFTEAAPDLWMEGVRSVNLTSSSAPKTWTAKDWIVVNIQESSYYRVNYDENLWVLLMQQLNGNDHERIHLLNRAQLIDDSLNLARAGKIDYEIPLSILGYLIKEKDYVPWASANRGMTLLNRWLSGTKAHESYQTFIRGIIEPLYSRFGIEVVENEPKLDRYARTLAINLACQAGLASCLSQTSQKLQQSASTGVKIAPDLQSAIFCNGLRKSNSTIFFYLQNKMFQSQDQAERTLIINALGCSQDETLLSQFLNLAILPGNALRLQEKTRVLVAPVNNGELGLRVMMNFIRNNYQAVHKISSNQVDTMLSSIAMRIASQEMLIELNSLLTFLLIFDATTDVNAAKYRTSVQNNLNWQSKYLSSVHNWLVGGPQATSTEVSATTLGSGSITISHIALIICTSIIFLN